MWSVMNVECNEWNVMNVECNECGCNECVMNV